MERLEKKDQRAKERTVNEILGDSGQRFYGTDREAWCAAVHGVTRSWT